MPKTINDGLFHLIKSLTKAEKRQFKIFFDTGKANKTAKFVKLFDRLDSMDQYDEKYILKKEKDIKSSQLSNQKAHLYKQILISLRSFRNRDSIVMKIKDMIENATILFDKCLYKQSQKMIEKAKALASLHEQHHLMVELLNFEKKLTEKLIEGGIELRTNEVINNSNRQLKKLESLESFQNLSLKLYSLYMNKGFIKDHRDYEVVNSFFYSTIPSFKENELDYSEKILFYSALVRYHFFVQEPGRALEYARKCVNIFNDNNSLKQAYPESYIKSLNHLLTAINKHKNVEDFKPVYDHFEAIEKMGILYSDHLKLTYLKYSITQKCNYYFLVGAFDEGCLFIPKVAEKLESFSDRLDQQHLLIFYYKFACMYFGNEAYKEANRYLNKIINAPGSDMRNDIQCFARIISLICHYELNNADLIDHFIRSTYRFLKKKDDLYEFQKLIMKFLRDIAPMQIHQLLPSFKDLRNKMIRIKDNPYERRVFQYFDIISWLESKIQKRPVQDIIKEKIGSDIPTL